VFAEAVRQIAVLYDGLVVPGALLLLGSGTWLTITVYGGWAFLQQPWLAGMVALFAFEFIEGNTIGSRNHGKVDCARGRAARCRQADRAGGGAPRHGGRNPGGRIDREAGRCAVETDR
jgi:predicted integral membrane protein DUF2269